MTVSTMLMLCKAALLVLSFLTLAVSVAVFFLSAASDREKDAKIADRALSETARGQIIAGMSSFAGRQIIVGSVPNFGEPDNLARAIAETLRRVPGLRADLSQNGVAAEMGVSTPLAMQTPISLPRGVSVRFVNGNQAGRGLSETLAALLTKAGLVTTSMGNLDLDRFMIPADKRSNDKNDPIYSQVFVVVTEKP